MSYGLVVATACLYHGWQYRSHPEGVQGGARGEGQQRSDSRPRRQQLHALEGQHQGTGQTTQHSWTTWLTLAPLRAHSLDD